MRESYNQNALAVANFFIEKSDYKVTPLQLIKLVYFAYAWTMALTGKKLFDEEIEAWKFGPVIPSVYHSFKHYAKDNIKELSTELTFDDDFNFRTKQYDIDIEDEEDRQNIEALLSKVWDVYKKYDGYALIDMTHLPNSPWAKVYKAKQYNIQINDDDIETYFKEMIEKNKAAHAV